MYLCGLTKFCWHSIFCRISWFFLRQQMFAYSPIFCRVITRHFDNSAYFLLNQLISLTCQIFADTAYFCWVITMYLWGLTKFCWHSIFCWISWFFWDSKFLLTQLSLVESSSGILIIQQVFADTAYFCWISSFRWLVKFLLIQHIFAESSPGLLWKQNFCWRSIFCNPNHTIPGTRTSKRYPTALNKFAPNDPCEPGTVIISYCQVLNPDGISIGSAVFAGLTSVTDRPRYSVSNNRPHLRT